MPPNLILITVDEMRGDAPSFAGNPDCRTPNLDRLASQGVCFDRHYAVHGKCVPSRIAMLTGRYTHTDGFRTVNPNNLLPPGAPNLLQRLKSAGYDTAAFGHNHKWADFWGDNRESSGCTHYHSFTKGIFDGLLQTVHPAPAPRPGDAPVIETPDNCLEVRRLTGPRSGFCDDNRALQAVHYLRNVRDRSRPFFMEVDFAAPHPPYAVEEPYFSMADRRRLTPYEYGIGPGAPLHLRKLREIRGRHAREDVLRQLQAVYYGQCMKVDALIGQVLQAIEEEGLRDNSVIVFTSDHGDFAGQYSLPEKWDTAMNDCILRVPFILLAPGLAPGRRVQALSDHTDLAPAILDLLGLQADWVMHGESLLHCLGGPRRREAVFADGGHEAPMRARFNAEVSRTGADGREERLDKGKQAVYSLCPDAMARTKMIRTERWKLVIRETGGNELYDMPADPAEMNNLWDRPEHAGVCLELMQKMIEWCLRTDTDLPYQQKVGA